MVEADTSLKMVICMKDILKRDSEMDKEFLHGQIIAFIKVCLLNIRIMEK